MGLIFIDSCLIIYAFEDHPRHGHQVRQALARENPELLAISPLVMQECLVGPLRAGSLALLNHYERGLRQFETLSMPDEIYLHAARLRARFGLKTPDALHLATATVHGCSALWTADDRLQRAAGSLACNVLAGPAGAGP